jgi:hypothetical protein
MERLTLKITRPDFSVYEVKFTNVRVKLEEQGVAVYNRECHNLLAAFYPITWVVELVKVEIIE